MSMRMTAADWVRLDDAEARIAQARAWGYDPEPEDLELVAAYNAQ